MIISMAVVLVRDGAQLPGSVFHSVEPSHVRKILARLLRSEKGKLCFHLEKSPHPASSTFSVYFEVTKDFFLRSPLFLDKHEQTIDVKMVEK